MQTLTGQFAAAAREAPDRVGHYLSSRRRGPGVSLTASFTGTAWPWPAGSRPRGCSPGDRVAILLENRPGMAPELFRGAPGRGGGGAPGSGFPLGPIQYALEQTRARVIFTFPQAPLSQLQELPFLEKIVVVGEPGDAGRQNQQFHRSPGIIRRSSRGLRPCPPAHPDDLASIIYTSGTTGLPKGVMLSHKNFCANCQGIAQLNAIRPEDNFLAILPLHHAFPFTATLLMPLFSRARITYLDTLKAEAILRCIKEQRVTILVLTPQVLQHFYQGMERQLRQFPWPLRPLLLAYLKFSRRVAQWLGVNPAGPLLRKFRGALGEQFRFFVSGGAKLPESLAEDLARLGFTVLEGYGLTETAPVVTFNPPAALRPGSAGRPLAGVEVRIFHPDADGVGEVLIRGDNVMAGYFQNEAATREALQDGWFHSGDLGHLDRDGYLYLKGRIKDIIVLASGKNVSAEEVAQYYLQAPSIKEIFVTADARAEKLAAVVVPDLDFFRKIGEMDIYDRVKWDLELLSRSLEPYKRVRDFVLINEELPKTRLGKGQDSRSPAPLPGAGRQTDMSPKGWPWPKACPRWARPWCRCWPAASATTASPWTTIWSWTWAWTPWGWWNCWPPWNAGSTSRSGTRNFPASSRSESSSALSKRSILPRPGIRAKSWRLGDDLLKTEPPPALLRHLGMEGGFQARMVTQGLVAAMGLLFKWLFDLKVYGREGLKDQGYVLCPNHASFLDGFILVCAVPGAAAAPPVFPGVQPATSTSRWSGASSS